MSEKRSTKRVISLDIEVVGYKDALSWIVEKAKSRTPGYVCFANVHMVMEAYNDSLFAKQVNDATMVLADGMPVVNALKSMYGIRQDRIAGMDAMPELIRLAAIHGLKIFFFGTSNGLLEKIRSKIESRFPGIKIGIFSPPFDKSLDDPAYLKLINDSGANMVFIALGCPKQEKWMATHTSGINAILLGVGGAFPVYAGTTKRAPKWVQDLSLEWMFRLFQEPGRLFRRYLFTNTLFLYLLAKNKIKGRNS